MYRKKLQQVLNDLSTQYSGNQDLPTQRLISEIEQIVVTDDVTIGAKKIREKLEDWEESHPELTSIINRVSDILAQMGI